MTENKSLPLRRVFERAGVATLLGKAEAMIPGLQLALIDTDGRLFAGSENWFDPLAARELITHGTEEIIVTHDLMIKPLVVESLLWGAVVANTFAQEAVLGFIHQSLLLLLNEAMAKRDLARETLERYREINMLYLIGETIGACLDLHEIPGLALSALQRVIEADGSSLLLRTTDSDETLEEWAAFGALNDGTVSQAEFKPVITHVLESLRPDIFPTAPDDQMPAGVVLCAPLKLQERVYGAILLYRAHGKTLFTAGDEKLVMALASQVANAVETARLHEQEIQRQRLEEELAIGRQIQLGMLPPACPQVPGWEFAAVYQAAQQVGGDLYDFFFLPDHPEQLGIVIADVTGKGVPAALFMGLSRTIIRIESMAGRNPSTVLEQFNRVIIQDNRYRLYLTAFHGILNLNTGRFLFASGGHDWPLWYRHDLSTCKPLKAKGVLLGAFEGIELEECEIQVAPGDMLIFYTDGVTEARNAYGDLFGDEALESVITAHRDAGAEDLAQAILGEVNQFKGHAPPADDFTLFVVKRDSVPAR